MAFKCKPIPNESRNKKTANRSFGFRQELAEKPNKLLVQGKRSDTLGGLKAQ